MSYFDTILDQFVPDEADRAVIKKHAPLVARVDELARINATNQDWFTKNWIEAEGKTVKEQALEQLVAQQNERLAAVAAGGNADMGFDEILAGLTAKGFVDTAALNAKVEEAKQFAKETVNGRDMGVLAFWKETANLPIKHKDEFGEELDTEKFLEAYTKNPNAGARTVYDSFVSGLREAKRNAEVEKLKADSQTAIDKAREEGLAAGRQQAAIQQAQNQGGMPVDQGNGSGNMGWLQKQKLDRALAKDADGNQMVPGGRLGDGSATAAIMAQRASDIASGKITVQQ